MTTAPARDVTLLWALRSPCDLACRYCYFGLVEDHRAAPPQTPGALSHLARTDLDLATILDFIATLPGSRIGRVFLAGGEPLIWRHALRVIKAIKATGVELVLCTNGLPLNRPEVVEAVLTFGVDAVSISVDSADPMHHDAYRPSRSGRHGHSDVIAGIRTLLTARGTHRLPRVGLYSVITRRNISAILDVASLAFDLGCDYFVPQPISLASDHPLFAELTLTTHEAPDVRSAFDLLYTDPPVGLPPASYPGQFLTAITANGPRPIHGCFGGRQLFFIEPDGSVWDCPSALRIAATPAGRRRTIAGRSAADLFGDPGGCGDCSLFSADCVNMWPLMAFNDLLADKVGS